jgi:hypothetical protein
MLTGKDFTQEEAREYGCASYIPKGNLGKVVPMARILLSKQYLISQDVYKETENVADEMSRL